MVNSEYVDKRFCDFVKKYERVLTHLKFDEETIKKFSHNLSWRLINRDFVKSGSKPINALHTGKRVTRFLIKLAIETCPARKSFKERLLQEYYSRMEECRKTSPDAVFFSFESTYANKLRINFAQYRDMFRL